MTTTFTCRILIYKRYCDAMGFITLGLPPPWIPDVISCKLMLVVSLNRIQLSNGAETHRLTFNVVSFKC